ncbi:phage tail baseplate protein [Altericroceibacterium xinjiangense]|uniref:GTA baseplate fiber-binding domain-containing protein n=1 Tax=Altericroceibacterium xinjiangense TaxID=762261 RepID=UPI000F7EEF34|nr:phage tail protein [Altericroceibacterium xinjiangense]
MATLVFSAIGTMAGGPLGGAIGALVGRHVDQAVIGGSRREGPRVKDLAVTTSSYGSALPRHYGRMRTAGTIIWATDLAEQAEQTGGGKGSPSATTYSYSVSLAVALSSRPIARVERIWADGNLLRGAAGDLKTGGSMRIYTGHGDQPADPLIASDKGAASPAHRGMAYCVFEALDLTDFGNRIPALTFEVVADDDGITLAQLLDGLEHPPEADRNLVDLAGFTNEGGSLLGNLSVIDQVYPLSCDAGGDRLSFCAAETIPSNPPLLPPAAAADDGESFGNATGETRQRLGCASDITDEMRYYDMGRDFQAGLQRADGRARPGRSRVLEFPGALEATQARTLINQAAERARSSREVMGWRIAELDPQLIPGAVVRVPGHGGLWRVESWEWRDRGIELELRRLPRGPARQSGGDAGTALSARDEAITLTDLVAYELPWDGSGGADNRLVFAAPSSESGGWRGAALYLETGGQLAPLGNASRRSILGRLLTPLPSSPALLLERGSVDVELVSDDFSLDSLSVEALAGGGNRALIGDEIVQFSRAAPIGPRAWRLSGVLRGRGGTEAAAGSGHPADTRFVLIDDRPIPIDAAKVGSAENVVIAALGLADSQPVRSGLINSGISARPLCPVHPRCKRHADGSLTLGWTRRARGVWTWPGEVEIPLNEQSETYLVGVGPVEEPWLRWIVHEPRLEIGAGTVASLLADHSDANLWVRQSGNSALSPPLLLTTLS